MLPYQSPALCARCGSPDVAANWKANTSTTPFNVWLFLSTWFGVYASRYGSSTFVVPVCSNCGVQLTRIKKTTRGITIFMAVLLGLLLGIGYLAIGVRGNNLVAGITLMVFLTLFGAMVGAAGGIVFGLVIQEALNYEFCTYDGQTYHFKNKKFRREFTLLNPTLIKPQKKK